MKRMYEYVSEFLKKKSFTIPLILFSVLGYGFQITNFSISVDDLARERYYSGELFAQGRFTSVLLKKLLHLRDLMPFAEDFISVLLIMLGAVLFCALIKRASDNFFSDVSYTIFASAMCTFPLIAEIFVYRGANLCQGVGFVLVPIAAWVMLDGIEKKNLKLPTLAASIIIMFITSMYEAFIIVYITAVLIVLYFKSIRCGKSYTIGAAIKEGLTFAIPIVIGVVLEAIVSNGLILLLGLTKSEIGDTGTGYFSLGVGKTLKRCITGHMSFFIKGLGGYYPIMIYLICLVLSFIMLIRLIIKKRGAVAVLLFLGIIASIYALPVLQGTYPAHRKVCQVMALFCGFIMLLCSEGAIKCTLWWKLLRPVVIFLLFFAIFGQSVELNRLFSMNYQRYCEENGVLESVYHQLRENFDLEKPVAFVGEYELSDAVAGQNTARKGSLSDKIFKSYGDENKKVTDSIGNSCITWAIRAFEGNTEILNIYHYMGLPIEGVSPQLIEEAKEKSKDMPPFPDKDCIRDDGSYIIVKMGKVE